jgi:hypothetical protein
MDYASRNVVEILKLKPDAPSAGGTEREFFVEDGIRTGAKFAVFSPETIARYDVQHHPGNAASDGAGSFYSLAELIVP